MPLPPTTRRPRRPRRQVGKAKGSVNVPLVLAKWKYNAETRKKEAIKEDNPDFIAQAGGCWAPQQRRRR